MNLLQSVLSVISRYALAPTSPLRPPTRPCSVMKYMTFAPSSRFFFIQFVKVAPVDTNAGMRLPV